MMYESVKQRKSYYYKTMSDEQKAKHRERGRQWAANNRVRSRCSAHTNAVRKKYPDQFNAGNLQSSKLLAEWVISQGNCLCPYCGVTADSIDHIVPLSKGGEHSTTNLQLLCNDCNLMKGNKTEDEFLTKVKQITSRFS